MTGSDIYELLHLPYTELQHMADAVRRTRKGSHVFVRGLIEFSNSCICNCCYCGLRRANTEITRYSLTPGALLDAADAAVRAGVDTFVLQSGEDPDQDADQIAGYVVELKRRYPGIAVTLAAGERSREEYRLWKEAGADRYLIKHETANPDQYARLHPGRTLETRLAALRTVQSLGYAAGSGFIIGLPDQTEEDIIKDILLVQELQVAMCGVGPFLPQAQTPLKALPRGSVPLTLRVMAILRIVLPDANIPATTALASLDPVAGQTRGLMAGGNVLMPSFTPPECRLQYRIYDNKKRVGIAEAIEAITAARRTHGLREPEERGSAP